MKKNSPQTLVSIILLSMNFTTSDTSLNCNHAVFIFWLKAGYFDYDNLALLEIRFSSLVCCWCLLQSCFVLFINSRLFVLSYYWSPFSISGELITEQRFSKCLELDSAWVLRHTLSAQQGVYNSVLTINSYLHKPWSLPIGRCLEPSHIWACTQPWAYIWPFRLPGICETFQSP